MNNRILLISGNFYPEPTGIGKYSGEMIDWLSENGYDCTVITTFPYYPDWKVQEKYKRSRFLFKKEIRQSKKVGSFPITIIRCPHYIPTSPTGFKRLLSEFTISFSCYLALFFLFFVKRYNYVLTVAPPFELGLLGVLYKKIRGGIFIYHIQDLQIDAARELGMIKSSKVLKVLSALEKYVLNKADSVSTISEGMIKKIKIKCSKDIIYFPNWVNTTIYFPVYDKVKCKIKFGFDANDRIILYSGAIGEKQGLRSILNIAKSFEGIRHIRFVICGSGPYKGHLVREKENLALKNVDFFPLQPFEDFNAFLNMADIHLILQKSQASDLLMPSKLSTILSVGGFVIATAHPGTSLANIISDADLGMIIEPENEEILKDAIEKALNLDMGIKTRNARIYAENYYSTDKVLSKFATSLLAGKKKVPKTNSLEETVLLSGG